MGACCGRVSLVVCELLKITFAITEYAIICAHNANTLAASTNESERNASKFELVKFYYDSYYYKWFLKFWECGGIKYDYLHHSPHLGALINMLLRYTFSKNNDVSARFQTHFPAWWALQAPLYISSVEDVAGKREKMKNVAEFSHQCADTLIWIIFCRSQCRKCAHTFFF